MPGKRNTVLPHKGVRWEPITPEEKQIEKEVLAARPESVRHKRFARPNYLYDPKRVKAYYDGQARRGADPAAPRIPREKQVIGGTKSRRTGIPSGYSREQVQISMALIEQQLLARMEELESKLPEKLKLSPLLDEAEREETGIVLNPVFYLQRIFASGLLSMKEQVDVLKLLMEYTHTKKAQKQSINLTSQPEAFLAALADTDERVVDGRIVDESKEAIGD